MAARLKVNIIGGDLLPAGAAYLAPDGILWSGGSVLWVEIARVGAQEKELSFNPLAGGIGAAALGYGAALFAGPVGIAGAAVVGAALAATRLSESFEIWDVRGRFISIKAASGTMKRAREWREVAHKAARALTRHTIEANVVEQPDREGRLAKLTHEVRKRLPKR